VLLAVAHEGATEIDRPEDSNFRGLKWSHDFRPHVVLHQNTANNTKPAETTRQSYTRL